MNMCQKCNNQINYDQEYVSIVHQIESTRQKENGDLYIQVISGEELLVLCSECGENLTAKNTQKWIKQFVSQNAASN